MREGWDKKSIGEIALVSYGFTGKAFAEGEYRYVRITDIDGNGELTNEEKRYVKHSDEAQNFLLEDNDLLMARTGATFAKVLLHRNYEPSIFASYLIRINFKEKIINKLYWYFTKSEDYWEQANSLSSGSAQPHFNGAALKKVIFAYPKSLQEQQQIVAILDEVFKAIDQAKANIEKNIQNAKELFQSKLNDIFRQPARPSGGKGEGWEEKTLGEVCDIVGGGTPSKSKEEYYKGDIFWATVRDMNTDKLSITDHKISEIGLKNSSSNIIPKNHVIIATRVGLGKVCILEQDTAINQDLKGLLPKLKYKILNDFIFWWYKSISNKVVEAGTGATVQGVKLPFIKSLMFPLTSLDEQNRVINILNKFSHDIEILEKKYLEKQLNLEELKKSILQKAFAGELTKSEDVSLTPEQKHAMLIAWSYSAHRNAGTELTFGHTKSEKMIHVFESYAEIDLNRNPIKDAAGPNDFNKVIEVIEPLAKKEKYFSVTKESERYTYGFAPNTFKGITKLKTELNEQQKTKAQDVISLFLDKNTEEAELIATVYAAWNNLLIKKEKINDKAIVYEARENWHPNKLKIDRYKFFETIDILRTNNIVPKGKGKLVEKRTLF